MQANPYAKMRENAVMTAPKEELTLMLYDGAVRFVNQAHAASKEKDVNKTHYFLLKTQEIIREFQLTLDRKHEISQHFDTMYEYIHRRLVEANVSKAPETIQECGDLIREMRDTWREAITIARQSGASSTPQEAGVNLSTGSK